MTNDKHSIFKANAIALLLKMQHAESLLDQCEREGRELDHLCKIESPATTVGVEDFDGLTDSEIVELLDEYESELSSKIEELGDALDEVEEIDGIEFMYNYGEEPSYYHSEDDLEWIICEMLENNKEWRESIVSDIIRGRQWYYSLEQKQLTHNKWGELVAVEDTELQAIKNNYEELLNLKEAIDEMLATLPNLVEDEE